MSAPPARSSEKRARRRDDDVATDELVRKLAGMELVGAELEQALERLRVHDRAPAKAPRTSSMTAPSTASAASVDPARLPRDITRHIASFLGGLATPHQLPLRQHRNGEREPMALRRKDLSGMWGDDEEEPEYDDDEDDGGKRLVASDEVAHMARVNRAWHAGARRGQTVDATSTTRAYAATFEWVAEWLAAHGQESHDDNIFYVLRRATDDDAAPLVVPMHIDPVARLRHPAHIEARARAWNRVFGGTPAKHEAWSRMFEAMCAPYASTWAPPVATGVMGFRNIRYLKAPTRDATPLETLLRQCTALRVSRYEDMVFMNPDVVRGALAATVLVYGAHAAHATLTWLMLMHEHRVFVCEGQRRFEQCADVMYPIVQALAHEPDTSPRSIQHAFARVGLGYHGTTYHTMVPFVPGLADEPAAAAWVYAPPVAAAALPEPALRAAKVASLDDMDE